MTWSLGSSEAATVLGLDPWGSPLEVWLRAVGRLERTSADTPATRRGSGLEAGVGLWFAKAKGFVVMPGPTLQQEPVRHPDYPWLHSRVDLFVWERGWGDGGSVCDAAADVKTARYLDEEDGWGPDGSDRIPKRLLVQMLVHLACHPWTARCWVPALGTVDDDFRVYCIERAAYAKRIDRVVAQLGAWVERHVYGGVPPEADGRDRTTRALDRGVPAQDRLKVSEPGLLAKARLAKAKRSTAREVTAELERVVQEVKLGMGVATELVDERGRVVATWRPDKTGTRRFRWVNANDEEDEG